MTPGEAIQKSIEEICLKYRISEEVLLGHSRIPYYVVARSELVGWLRMLGLSYPYIGKLMNRHHTSVIHLYKIHQKNLLKNNL